MVLTKCPLSATFRTVCRPTRSLRTRMWAVPLALRPAHAVKLRTAGTSSSRVKWCLLDLRRRPFDSARSAIAPRPRQLVVSRWGGVRNPGGRGVQSAALWRWCFGWLEVRRCPAASCGLAVGRANSRAHCQVPHCLSARVVVAVVGRGANSGGPWLTVRCGCGLRDKGAAPGVDSNAEQGHSLTPAGACVEQSRMVPT